MNAVATVDSLHVKATELTGLLDFGSPDYLEGLEVVLSSLDKDAGLTPAGVEQARSELTEILVSRLLSEDGWKKYPEHAEVRIERPVFITGMPRTATTALHRLLTADPAHQGLPMWLGIAPQPRPLRSQWAANPHFQQIDKDIRDFVDARPGYLGLHNTSAAEPDECWLLLRQSLTSFFFEFSCYVPTYSKWLAGRDLRPSYQRHRRNLQLIGLTRPGRRWVLKDPGHAFGIDALLDTYPDALVIQTHRDPATVVPSLCSLIDKHTSGASTVYRGELLGRAALDLTHRGLSAFTEARRRHDAHRFYDVWFDDFAADPISVVEDIYARLDAPLTDETRARMVELQLKDDKRRSHTYEAADFGLSSELINERFGALQ
ncbi:sulfotransferase family protein [Streptomyces botrytidirepellens]|uniref:Sulfotransferase n=1 Tax=Streptomyces botrytidirepellens TaxID=2486417 RepID=A0A3M8WYE8_9ACTN|nr:sulfotransferase [Streptomyces botrytidirepellens]RNG34169.1 sulfotransferase [Streptomyces botrytidirepellens]